MRYALAVVDLDPALPFGVPDVTVPAGSGGLGLLLRHRARPLQFIMLSGRGGEVLPASRIERAAAREAGSLLLELLLEEQLRPQESAASLTFPVTVAVCTRERPDDLDRCLRSLAEARGREQFEVLVVDNAPATAATRTVVARWPGVRYVSEPLAGLNFARNRALRSATTDFVAYVDDDVRVDPGWWQGLQAALQENPDAACVTGLVLPAELDSEAQILFERRGGFRRGFRGRRFVGTERAGAPLHPLGAGEFGAGCAMAFRRSAMLGLGGFDEALDTGAPLPGGGDLDAFQRILSAGLPLVYEPRMLVHHRHRRDLAALQHQYRTWGEGFFAYLDKTWRAQPASRSKIARMALYWHRQRARELRRALRAGDALERRMVVSEWRGGLRGAVGTYVTSRRRSARLRRAGGVR